MSERSPAVSAAPLKRWLNVQGRGAKAMLARKLNVSQAVLTNWLRRGVPPERVLALAKAIGLSGYDDYLREAGVIPRGAKLQQPLALYSLPPDKQAVILTLFDRLTAAQQEDFISQLEAAVKSNEAIVREVGGRLSHPSDKKVAQALPLPPKR